MIQASAVKTQWGLVKATGERIVQLQLLGPGGMVISKITMSVDDAAQLIEQLRSPEAS